MSSGSGLWMRLWVDCSDISVCNMALLVYETE